MPGLLVNIDVDDLEGAIEFYRSALGLRLKRLLFDGSVAEMVGASSPIYLLRKPAGSLPATGVSRPRDYRRHWTPVHLDFVVEDLQIALRHAQAGGARLEGDVEAHAWGRIAFMSDPFGHGFCLLQFAGRGYDEDDHGAPIGRSS